MVTLARHYLLFAFLLSPLLSACGGSRPPAAPIEDGQCAPTVSDPSSRPLTIPALREWQASGAPFAVKPDSRIGAPAALRDVAETFAEDLSALTGQQIAVGDGGDITLALGNCDPTLGDEGYRLQIDGSAKISARSAHGVFNGTRTLLQLLHQAPTVPGGIGLDWPRYPERGLMVDAGRKYFTPAWLESRVRELAYLKLNYLHLHFSDNEGFRIESESHPEIVSEEHLTKAEVRDLLALAQRYFVTVVPEIDMPGHMTQALAAHPDLQLTNAAGQRAASQLDVTNPDAFQFATELIEEYLGLFPGPYWHTGSDEYMPPYEYPLYPQLERYAKQQYGGDAAAKDAVHGFTNQIDELVRTHGRTTRMWHDDLNGSAAVTVNPDIVVEWWTNFSPLSDPLPPAPQTILDWGHVIENSGWFPTYYVNGPTGTAPPKPDMTKAYEEWEPHQFYGPLYANGTLQFPPDLVAADEPRNLGAKLNVWNDDPAAATEEEIATGIFPRLRVIAQKTWDSPLLVPAYADFEPIMEAVGGAPEPGPPSHK